MIDRRTVLAWTAYVLLSLAAIAPHPDTPMPYCTTDAHCEEVYGH